MKWSEFVKRFNDGQEIGRDITDEHLDVFYDNGSQVGRIRQDRRTTEGEGLILSDEEAVCCRDWCKRMKEQQGERRR